MVLPIAASKQLTRALSWMYLFHAEAAWLRRETQEQKFQMRSSAPKEAQCSTRQLSLLKVQKLALGISSRAKRISFQIKKIDSKEQVNVHDVPEHGQRGIEKR